MGYASRIIVDDKKERALRFYLKFKLEVISSLLQTDQEINKVTQS